MENSEQWKLQGKCPLCRKANYCSKECTAHKRSKEAFVNGLIHEMFDEISGGAYSRIMNQSAYNSSFSK